MEEKIVIRNATPADEKRIAEIATQQWTAINENYKKLIGDDLYRIFYGTVEGRVKDVLASLSSLLSNPERFIVTEVDGVVAGFATYRTENVGGVLAGVIGRNAMDNNYKGRGIAGKQYAILFERMKKDGCVCAKVHTGMDEMHAPARRAYEKAGFSGNLPDINYFRTLKPGDEVHNPKPTEENIVVRGVVPADEERIMEIAAQQWDIINNNYKRRIGDELFAIYYGTVEKRVSDVIASLRAMFKNNPEAFVVTEVNGKVAGFATYRVADVGGVKCGVLGRNGVDNNFKGRGIAGRQYAALYAKMLADGCTVAKVHTGLDEMHAPARRAYEKSGFNNNIGDVNYYMMF